MKKENALITQESTEVVLRKATNIMNRTNKILKNSKKELMDNPDVMMINGLIWQKETVEEMMTWDDAMEYAKNLRLGGYDDWRLPTIQELEEVVSSCNGINNEATLGKNEIASRNFKNKSYTQCYKSKGFIDKTYWSLSIFANSKTVISLVSIAYGCTTGSHINDSWSVRCVRGANK